jgi:arginyl-tRNA--protein-N-Asp/Glu arginylyltransferase
MKIFSSEVAHDYGTYTFAYAQYARKEKSDTLGQLYDAGYLPYSGARGSRDIFYMARSARVVLADFELTSENRRIAKKFDGRFTKERIPFSDFEITEDFLTFCLTYFAQKHGEKAMPKERLKHILSMGIISHLIVYRSTGSIVAYVLEVDEGALRHYWFSFYDLSLAKQSLGLWLMLDCVRDAKAASVEHYYLGTVYGEKALYKTNFEPLEWLDGSSWNTDINLLKSRGRSDAERVVAQMDEWKKDKKLF